MTNYQEQIMKPGIQTGKRLPYHRRNMMHLSFACMSFPAAAAMMTNRRLVFRNSFVAKAFPTPWLLLGTDTKLKTKRDNNDEDDFVSFDDFGQEDEGGQELARAFYEELDYRQRQPSSEFNPTDNDEKLTVSGSDGKNKINKDGSKKTIKAVRIRADGNNASSVGSRRALTNQPTKTSSQGTPPAFSLFQSLFPVPAPRPAASAGLFSGSGATVYSSGRSVRAEIEILETTIKNNDAKTNKRGWDGSEELSEEVIRVIAVSVLIVCAWVAVDASGGLMVIPWDGAASSANHAVGVINDAMKDEFSSIMISVGNGDVFLGEEAALLMRESSDLAASVLEEAVRSVEELVLF